MRYACNAKTTDPPRPAPPVYNLVCDNDCIVFCVTSSHPYQNEVCCRLQAKIEDQAGALKKKMAAPEYAGRTPVRIKESDTDKLGKLLKEQQSLDQQLSDMRRLLQPQ